VLKISDRVYIATQKFYNSVTVKRTEQTLI